MSKEECLRLLSQSSLNKYELAEKAQCHQRTAQRILAKLHAEKRLRICGWDVCYRYPIPRYKLGPGPNRPRPKPVPTIIVQRRRRRNPEVRWAESVAKKKKRALDRFRHLLNCDQSATS